MRALGVRSYGDASHLEIFDLPPPEPAEGEVLVRAHFAGVNHVDVAMRRGEFAVSSVFPTRLPLVLGVEGSGEIVRLGRGVQGLRTGDRVAFCLNPASAADLVVVPARNVLPLPQPMSFELAAALPVHGLAAHYLTQDVFPVREGDVCVVTGAAGGVGRLLVQIAKRRGALVVAVVGDETERATAKALRADHCFTLRDDRLVQHVRELARGVGAHVAFDAVGRDASRQCLAMLRPGGLYVSFGNVSGDPPPVSFAELGQAGSLFAARPHLYHFIGDETGLRRRWDDVCRSALAGEMEVAIDRAKPLEAAEESHRALEGRAARGKLLLDLTGSAQG